MTATSILAIDVQDEKFRAFQALFEKYQDAVKKLPGAWGATNAAMGGAAGPIADMTAALLAQQEMLNKNAAAQGKIGAEAERTNRAFGGLAHSSGAFAKNVGAATVSLVKWASITTTLAGLLGAGGLFGIDRLALSAGGARRSAQGLGVTSGEQQAFAINFGRYLDPNANLANIADAQSDFGKRWAFSAMGMDANRATQEDPARLAAEMAPIARQIFDQGGGTQQYAEAHGLLQFYTMDELRRLHATSMRDLQQSGADFRRDATGLAVDPDVLRRWQDFSIQLDRARTGIENTFIRGLEPLAPALGKLSASFEGAVQAFLSNPQLKVWIGDLAQEIDVFAKYLGSPAVKEDIDSLFVNLKKFADAVEDVAVRFENWVNPQPPIGGTGIDLMTRDRQPEIDPAAGKPVATSFLDSGVNGPMSTWGDKIDRASRANDGNLLAERQAKLQLFDQRAGLPAGTMDHIWKIESGRGQNMGPSAAGAFGDFQLMPATAAALGVTRRWDFDQNAVGATRNMFANFERYHHDLDEALAAYNWGPGNLDADLKQHGDHWRDFLPEQTANYLREFHRLAQEMPATDADRRAAGSGAAAPAAATSRPAAPSPQARININNQTGGSAVVTVAALPY